MIKMEVNLRVKSVQSNEHHDRIIFEPVEGECLDDDHVDLRPGHIAEMSISTPAMLGRVRPGMVFKAEYLEEEVVPEEGEPE